MQKNEQFSIFGLLLNILLFSGKLFAGLISGSVALIGDALESLSDILTSIGILVAIRTGNRRADKNHPFGHHQAEPLAGFVVAMFTAILGFQIIVMGVNSFLTPKTDNITFVVLVIVVISMLIKLFMYVSFHKRSIKLNSPGLNALAIDSRNDVFRAVIIIVALISSSYGLFWIESIVAVLIGFGLFYSAYSLGKNNVDMLMGRAPPKKFLTHIKKEAKAFPHILGIGDIRATYSGNLINFEIVVMMNPRMSVKSSHDVAAKLRDKLQEHEDINRVFVHIDPFKG